MQLQWTQKPRRRTDEELARIEAEQAAENRMWEAAQKAKEQPPLPKKQKEILLPKVTESGQIKGLQCFVKATAQAFNTLETNAAQNSSRVAFQHCNQVTSQILTLVLKNHKIDEATACLYRNTTVQLRNM
ncbi:hypothetical protein F444_20390 [Phytophthora nicotianae P1976]|uniref:Uncharacterized protein n=1 Tax=Phytophthora nicotianae P1976 TaxID=1317066 RepID=A0A080Z4Q7_PHYNI|nr:hypothetical protein F444_20390 [Phytophthora nicotianae P1976]